MSCRIVLAMLACLLLVGPSAAAEPPDGAGGFRTGTKAGEEWTNGTGLVFCWCPPGRFVMGSPPELTGRGPDEGPVEVTLTHGFWIGKYEVTRGQTEKLVRQLPRRSVGTEPDHPVDAVTHEDIGRLLRALTERESKAGRRTAGSTPCPRRPSGNTPPAPARPRRFTSAAN